MKLRLRKLAGARASCTVFAAAPAAIVALGLVLVLGCQPAAAQKNKRGKTTTTTANNTANLNENAVAPPIPKSDADQIDYDIGQMLAAFQLGNVEGMHKYYSDNVTFVSGDFSPPVVGWQNYVPLYQRQLSAFQGIQLIRRNTIIFPHGDVAWAMYQWEFIAGYNNKPYSMRGQTTLIFNKVDGNWMIVHNHTSAVDSSSGTQTTAAAQQAPAGATAKP